MKKKKCATCNNKIDNESPFVVIMNADRLEICDECARLLDTISKKIEEKLTYGK